MSLISLVVVLIIVGVLLYLVNTQLPIEANIKKIINIVVIIAICFWLLQIFGILPDLNAIQVGG